MTLLETVNNLYLEMLIAAMILLGILLYNNLVLYRQKLRDALSLMLIFAIAMCAFEILWEICSGHPSLKFLTYLGGCGYVMLFLMFGIYYNRYILDQFGLLPNKIWQNMLLYIVPFGAMLLLCVTTPWTRWLIWVDENGVLQEMALFGTLFYGLLLFYILSSVPLAIYHALRDRDTNPSRVKTAYSMIVFGLMAPAIYLLQISIMKWDSDYLALSLSIAISLVFLITHVSTRSLMETQAHVEAVETDLRIAAKIQADALPPVSPVFAKHLDLQLRASMITAKEVGGDFYDYFAIDENRICFLIADVSGKGTPAALFMMTAKTMIKDYALTHRDTADIFTAVNRRLSENNETGMFATAWIGILDTRTMVLQYTNAGHNYPLFLRRGESCKPVKKVHGLFLAGFDDTEYRSDALQMTSGDRLFLYTDGVTEAHNRNKALYGTEKLVKVLEATSEESGEKALDEISKDVSAFADGEPQFDDITMLILSIK